jgi:nucleoside-triphosphatase THEP1
VICILTGPVHSGKTTLLRRIAASLEMRGAAMAGFLSLAVFRNGKPIGYDLHDLENGSSMPFIRREGDKGWQRTGDHFFLPEGLEAASTIVRRFDRSGAAGVLIVDEIGPLEMKGYGLWLALEPVLARGAGHFLLVARDRIADDLADRLARSKDAAVMIFNAGEEGVQSRIVAAICPRRPQARQQ